MSRPTWTQLARMIGGDFGLEVSDEWADFALWEQTAWPCCGIAHTTRQLRRYFAECERESSTPEEQT